MSRAVSFFEHDFCCVQPERALFDMAMYNEPII